MACDKTADEPNYKEQYPGFSISCDKCGSQKIEIDNSLGYSAESGGWGEVSLVCHGCDAEVEIVSS